MATASGYTANDIQVLAGATAVRRVPGMYIGSLDSPGLHRMLWEVVGNAVDEHLDGSATYVRVTSDGHRMTVEDDGRGIPVDVHPIEGRPALEVVMTSLHGASGKTRHVHLSKGLHGVGVGCVTALSDQLDAEVWRDGRRYVQSYSRGVALGPVRDVGASTRTGTRISFVPDFTILRRNDWDTDLIRDRCRELAAITPRLTVIVGQEAYRFVDGLAGLMHYRYGKDTMTEAIHLRGNRDGIEVEIALAWSDRPTTIVGFVNGSNTDGTHMTGFRAGVLRAFKRRNETTSARALQRGMIALINVMIVDPRFRSPCKDWLVNPEVGAAVASVVENGIDDVVRDNPALVDSLLLRLGA